VTPDPISSPAKIPDEVAHETYAMQREGVHEVTVPAPDDT
jgi:hypothetical protein